MQSACSVYNKMNTLSNKTRQMPSTSNQYPLRIKLEVYL